MGIENISVDLKLYYTKQGKRKGRADVVIQLGPDGAIPIRGFAIDLADEKRPRVYEPCVWNDRKRIQTVTLLGRIKADVDSAILRELERKLETEPSEM